MDEAAILSILDEAAATGAAPPDAAASLARAGAGANGPAAAALGAYAARAADALPKNWGDAGAAAGADAALAGKAAALDRLLGGLDGGDALASCGATSLRTAFEARERVAAAAALRAIVNRRRAGGGGGAGGALAASIDAAGRDALPATPAAASRAGGDAFFSAPVRSLPAWWAHLPAAAQAALAAADDAGVETALDALTELEAGADAVTSAALTARTAARGAHPAAAALALRGAPGAPPDWLSDAGARAGLTALALALGSALSATTTAAPSRVPALADTAARAAGAALDAYARGAAAAAAAGPRGASGGTPTRDEYASAASALLRPLLAAADALDASGDASVASRTRDAVAGLAAAHGAHGERFAALSASPDPAPLHAAIAAPPPRGVPLAAPGTFADAAFAAIAASPAPSALLELPAAANEALRAWLSARGPRDPLASRLTWLHDIRTRRYLGAAASLTRLAGDGGVPVGEGVGVSAARARARPRWPRSRLSPPRTGCPRAATCPTKLKGNWSFFYLFHFFPPCYLGVACVCGE